MSHVADTFLVISYEDKDLLPRINAALQVCSDERQHFLDETLGRYGEKENLKPYGGTKALQVNVYVAAVSYLDIEKFVRLLRDLPWYEPEGVQLLICDEHDEPRILTERFQIKDNA